jgi:hypothetical protein
MRRLFCGLILCASLLHSVPASAGAVVGSYTDLPLGTGINLTAEGTLDWVKWGLNAGGPGWTPVSKIGVAPVISRTLTPLGTPPAGTNVTLIGIAAIPPGNVMNFSWSDGSGPLAGFSDTIVTETILPAQFDYPIGLAASMTASGAAGPRILDVFVQGFNADMLITAVMSGGGSASVVVSPAKNPAGDRSNNYSSGRYRVIFSGAGEILTVTVRTVDPVRPGGVRFANAGFFAATLKNADQPLTLGLNGTAFRSGDTLILTAALTPGSVSGPVDAYVTLRVPGGGVLSVQLNGSLVPGMVPIARAFAPSPISSVEILRAQIPAGVVAGVYIWTAQLTQPGTVSPAAAIYELPFTLSP